MSESSNPVADENVTQEPAHPGHTALANLVNHVESALANLRDHVSANLKSVEGHAKSGLEHILDGLQRTVQDARNVLEYQQGSPVVGKNFSQSPSPVPASPIQDDQSHPGGTAAAQQSRQEQARDAEGNDEATARRKSSR